MNLTVLRLSFAFLWLVIGLGLVFREHLFPALGMTEAANNNWTLAGVMALLFAGWNVFRTFVGNGPRRPPRSLPVLGGKPLATRAETPRPAEYIPELDFTKPDPPGEAKKT